MTRPALVVCSALAAAGFFTAPARCAAGWLTITNETPQEVVVQDGQSAEQPKSKRGKTVRLLPGEVYREYLPGEGQKTVQVYDARCATKPLSRTPVRWSSDEMRLTVVPDATGIRLSRAGVTPALSPVVPASVTTTPTQK